MCRRSLHTVDAFVDHDRLLVVHEPHVVWRGSHHYHSLKLKALAGHVDRPLKRFFYRVGASHLAGQGLCLTGMVPRLLARLMCWRNLGMLIHLRLAAPSLTFLQLWDFWKSWSFVYPRVAATAGHSYCFHLCYPNQLAWGWGCTYFMIIFSKNSSNLAINLINNYINRLLKNQRILS